MKPKAKEVIVSELGNDETVVSTVDRSRALILNATGSIVFDLCDGNHSIDAITAFICKHLSGSDPNAVRLDVQEIVDQLVEYGLVENGE